VVARLDMRDGLDSVHVGHRRMDKAEEPGGHCRAWQVALQRHQAFRQSIPRGLSASDHPSARRRRTGSGALRPFRHGVCDRLLGHCTAFALDGAHHLGDAGESTRRKHGAHPSRAGPQDGLCRPLSLRAPSDVRGHHF
jgi:hypothetical protein